MVIAGLCKELLDRLHGRWGLFQQALRAAQDSKPLKGAALRGRRLSKSRAARGRSPRSRARVRLPAQSPDAGWGSAAGLLASHSRRSQWPKLSRTT